jgi:hypothetical protein
LYWKVRIKDEYLRWYTIARKEYDDATEDDKMSGIVKKPVPVQVRTKVGKVFWLLESEEFWAEVAQEAEDTHVKAMQEWEEVKQAPTTPVQFHQYVASITFDPITYCWPSTSPCTLIVMYPYSSHRLHCNVPCYSKELQDCDVSIECASGIFPRIFLDFRLRLHMILAYRASILYILEQFCSF